MTTLGEKRVRVDFNVNNNDSITLIKKETAKMIDLLQDIRADEVSKNLQPGQRSQKELSGEKLRLIALAQTAYEEAAMWAVKAVTI